MKSLLKLLSFAFLIGMVIVACEGPMGPAGEDGIDGTNGTNGTDGTAKCSTCHNNSALIVAKQLQYENSLHAMGENAAYANRPITVSASNDCSKCHSSQGFLDFNADGALSTSYSTTMQYKDVQQPNCYTCHETHKNFDETDWDLTYAGTHNLLLDNTAFNKGSANLCSKCHQARAVSPMPVVGGADVTLTSDRWGTHHGPVANVLTGTGLYKTVGTATYPTSAPHYAADACVTCHMANSYGDLGGGHTMNIEYDVHGTATLNLEGCVACHADLTALKTKITTLQSDVSAKLQTLQGLLTTAGIYDPANGRNKKGTFSADITGAYLNYQSLLEDRSNGVHNPAYTKALLDNSIEALTPPVK